MPRFLKFLVRDIKALSPVVKLILAAFVVLLWIMPFLNFSSFFMSIMIQFLLFSFFGMGWNTIGGYGGQIDLGKAQFVGIGAYTTTMFMVWWNVPPWFSAPVGVALAILWSFVIGYPLFLMKGHYFAIATIVASLILKDLFSNWELIRASRGVYLPMKEAPDFLYFQFVETTAFYYLILVLFFAGLIYLNWFRSSKVGYQLRAIKENEEAAESLGIDIRWAKVKTYAIASTFAATGGVFYALHTMYIDPEAVMSLDLSVQIALMAMLGGAGSLWGPVIGASFLVPLDRYLGAALGGLEAWQGIDLVIYGFMIMLVAAVEPKGIWGIGIRIRKRFKKRKDA